MYLRNKYEHSEFYFWVFSVVEFILTAIWGAYFYEKETKKSMFIYIGHVLIIKY